MSINTGWVPTLAWDINYSKCRIKEIKEAMHKSPHSIKLGASLKFWVDRLAKQEKEDATSRRE